MKYETEDRFKISDYIEDKQNYKADSEVLSKERKLIDAVETYLKIECAEAYQRNKLKEVFNKTREDKETRIKILNIIEDFILELT